MTQIHTNEAISKERIFTREFILLSVWCFLICNNFYALLTAMPMYSLHVMGLTETEGGIAAGLFIVGMLGSRFTAGKLMEAGNHRRLLLLNLIGMVAITTLYFFINSAAMLYVLRIISGIFHGILTNTIISLISLIIPRSRTGEGIGYYTMIHMSAWAVGPYVSVFFSSRGDYDSLFIYAIIMPAIALVTLPLLQMNKVNKRIEENAMLAKNRLTENPAATEQAPIKEESRAMRFIKQMIEPSIFPIAIVCFFVMLFSQSVVSFAAPYAETIGLTEMSSYFFIFYTIGLIGIRPVVSRMFDRGRGRPALIVGICVYIVAYYLLSVVSNSFMFMLSALLVGTGLGISQNITLAYAQKMVPRTRIAFANATYYVVFDICAALSPMIAGALIPMMGYHNMFLTASIWAAIGLPVFLILYGKVKALIEKNG